MAVMTGFRIYVFKELEKIPEGRVVTVTQLARLANSPGARDAVRRILRDGEAREYPYWRVVDEDGSLLQTVGGDPEHQREKLEQEDVEFLDDGKVDLSAHQVSRDDSS